MLRLHSTSPELWIYAADYAMSERGDVTEARSYMQRGLRFCSRSHHLWSEYLKLEMIYIAKIMARRHILGLDPTKSEETQAPDAADMDGDLIPVPSITIEDMGSEHQSSATAHQKIPEDRIASNPALTGAIPIAIFDSAMKKFPGDATFGAQMFNIVACFSRLQCTGRVLQHIVNTLITAAPTAPATLDCSIREPVVGLDATSKRLPGALIVVLDRFDSTMRRLDSSSNRLERITTSAIVSRRMVQWILPYLGVPELDPDIRAVLTSMVKTAWEHCLSDIELKEANVQAETTALLESLYAHGFKELIQTGLEPALRIWPDESRLQTAKASSP